MRTLKAATTPVAQTTVELTVVASTSLTMPGQASKLIPASSEMGNSKTLTTTCINPEDEETVEPIDL